MLNRGRCTGDPDLKRPWNPTLDKPRQGWGTYGMYDASQIKSWGHRGGALPGWLAIFEAEGQGFATLEYFAGEGQIRSVLLDLGGGDFNLVVGFERHAHVVEKFLGTKKDMHRVRARAILHYQVSDGLATRWRH